MTSLQRAFVWIALFSIAGCGDQGRMVDSAEPQGDENEVHMAAVTMQEFGIAVETAGPGMIEVSVTAPGEIVLNRDRVAHVVPRVSGVVQSVSKSEGELVAASEVLAVLDSRELSDIKVEYLGSLAREEIARATFEREEHLFEQRISSEQEFLDAQRGIAEAGLAVRSARQKLHALGLAEDAISVLPTLPEHDLVHFELTAPIDGIVIERHVSRGESLASDADAFVIADLSTVWVDLNVFQRDLDSVHEGLEVRFSTAAGHRGEGVITFVRPIVGEATRTAIARVVLPNHDGAWRPGVFVDARVIVEHRRVDVVIPRSALTELDGSLYVFVRTTDGFVAQPVVTGLEGEEAVEVLEGLRPGVSFASRGVFTLKAELEKDPLAGGHGH